jgi:translin
VGSTDNLEVLVERIRADLTHKSETRDVALARSRSLIRYCANSIRATHRHEFALAGQLLGEAHAAAATMCADARSYPDVYFAGYLQDALKELAEASIVLAMVQGESLPEPEALGIDYPAYLNGLGEAIGEMRRAALDCMRRDDITEAERLLGVMDDVLSALVTIDFPDALTGNLRRTTDMVRGVTERTRGDLTTAVREEKLQAALRAFEDRINARDSLRK